MLSIPESIVRKALPVFLITCPPIIVEPLDTKIPSLKVERPETVTPPLKVANPTKVERPVTYKFSRSVCSTIKLSLIYKFLPT